MRISCYQADHHIILASDRHPRNYVYNYFTDEGDAVKDVTKVPYTRALNLFPLPVAVCRCPGTSCEGSV